MQEEIRQIDKAEEPEASVAAEEGAASAAKATVPAGWLPRIVVVWIGAAVTMLATSAASYAMVWYITESTGSPLMLAVTYVCAFLPTGLLSPLGGIAADRFNRRTLVIICDLGIAVSASLFACVVVAGLASPPIVMVWCLGFAVFSAFRQPAFNAMMPQLVPEEHLIRINTLDSIISAVSMIAAPALGILLYTSIGFLAVNVVDAAGGLIAAACMFLVTVPTVRGEEGQGIIKNLAEGMHALSATKGILIITVVVAIGYMVYGPIDSLMPLMVNSHFGGDGFAASLVAATFGIGMLVGSVAIMIFGEKKPLTRIMGAAAVLFGVAIVVGGMMPGDAYPVFVGCMFLVAFSAAAFGAPLMTLIQTNISEEKLGRAMGLYSAMTGLAIPIGTAIGGVIAEVSGIPMFFVMCGILMVGGSFAIWIPASVRALDAREPISE